MTVFWFVCLKSQSKQKKIAISKKIRKNQKALDFGPIFQDMPISDFENIMQIAMAIFV